jgi:hypothetical protein
MANCVIVRTETYCVFSTVSWSGLLDIFHFYRRDREPTKINSSQVKSKHTNSFLKFKALKRRLSKDSITLFSLRPKQEAVHTVVSVVIQSPEAQQKRGGFLMAIVKTEANANSNKVMQWSDNMNMRQSNLLISPAAKSIRAVMAVYVNDLLRLSMQTPRHI